MIATGRVVRAYVAGGLLAAAAGLLSGTPAPGAVIYSDDFSGVAGSNLDTSAPDVRPGTETWTAGTAFKQDGTVAVATHTAYLPFVPQPGQLYRLSLDVNTTNVNDNFIGLGFTQLQPTAS